MGGLGALLAVNTVGAFTGVTLGYSWLSIGMAGVLGIPGVISLVLLDIM
jgi:inhibitor of the pro-sigma K processing machinery